MSNPIEELIEILRRILGLFQKLTPEQQAKVREVIADLGAQLDRSLLMADLYFSGADSIKDVNKLEKYLRGSQQTLLETYDRFQVCEGLGGLRDELQQTFKQENKPQEVKAIEDLLDQLAQKERMVLEELKPIFPTVENVADRLVMASPGRPKMTREEALESVTAIRRHVQVKRAEVGKVIGGITILMEK